MPEAWVASAKKVLKGKDPLEVLAWHTAEVSYKISNTF